ncbi:thiol-disulfide oxidoreductase DCC family protein [Pseudanabaena sp. ABRG5-3]|uniref:thiol-disulfide oxidoreductase DCC family protein n=1 Tax=Pseudanabaena sp. ABRG5-3 TaxID=685565 RepID=UPI000DC71537|nr:DCC1-like thiol-disulfide oxidoreductase family protein [Pseudanabaena sp. ABRG5-3]BBC22702.1 thiol-disulfide oxidoreductase DCC [Pseudanabaena sp. ABRG5-3]
MSYAVIYDGNCNLCANFVSILEKCDRGCLFGYIPMQDVQTLQQFKVTSEDCEMGMILINREDPTQRWQGSDAAEEIVRLLPVGSPLISAYRALAPLKKVGDAAYVQIRDHRYQLFGKRDRTYHTAYPIGCAVKTEE